MRRLQLDKKTREVLYQVKSRPKELFQIPIIHQAKGVQSAVMGLAVLVGQMVQSTRWHQRLAHPSNAVLSCMLRQSSIQHSIDEKHSVCSSCL